MMVQTPTRIFVLKVPRRPVALNGIARAETRSGVDVGGVKKTWNLRPTTFGCRRFAGCADLSSFFNGQEPPTAVPLAVLNIPYFSRQFLAGKFIDSPLADGKTPARRRKGRPDGGRKGTAGRKATE
ncbi:hypothetical protein KM043_002094 [Ampulex compressa]|nr:hypothetical protein KM043_002094 [Ampulex compressa]